MHQGWQLACSLSRLRFVLNSSAAKESLCFGARFYSAIVPQFSGLMRILSSMTSVTAHPKLSQPWGDSKC